MPQPRDRSAGKARPRLCGDDGSADRTPVLQLHCHSAALSSQEEIVREEGSKEDKKD